MIPWKLSAKLLDASVCLCNRLTMCLSQQAGATPASSWRGIHREARPHTLAFHYEKCPWHKKSSSLVHSSLLVREQSVPQAGLSHEPTNVNDQQPG